MANAGKLWASGADDSYARRPIPVLRPLLHCFLGPSPRGIGLALPRCLLARQHSCERRPTACPRRARSSGPFGAQCEEIGSALLWMLCQGREPGRVAHTVGHWPSGRTAKALSCWVALEVFPLWHNLVVGLLILSWNPSASRLRVNVSSSQEAAERVCPISALGLMFCRLRLRRIASGVASQLRPPARRPEGHLGAVAARRTDCVRRGPSAELTALAVMLACRCLIRSEAFQSARFVA